MKTSIIGGAGLGNRAKSSIFDRLHTEKTPKMKGLLNIMKGAVVAIVATLTSIGDAAAQCTIQYSGSPCVGVPVSFMGSSTGTTHDWNFNNENTQTGLKNLNYAFKTAGNKVVTYVTTINGTKCTSTLNLVVRESPKIKLTLQNLYEQCFEKNLFCFTDSTKSGNGGKDGRKKTTHDCGSFWRSLQRSGFLGLNGGSFLDQAGGYPVLGLGDRLAFSDLDDVAQVVFTLFVVRMVLARLGHDLAVEGVLDTTLHQHGHGLGALVADHLANQGALEGFFGFRHGHSLFGGLLFSKDGLGTGNRSTGFTQRARVAELLRGFLHAQTEVSLLQLLDLGFQAINVFSSSSL